MQTKELEDMVKEVNATQVPPEDLLSDKVQYYDRAAKTLGRKQEKDYWNVFPKIKHRYRKERQKHQKKDRKPNRNRAYKGSGYAAFSNSKKWRLQE